MTRAQATVLRRWFRKMETRRRREARRQVLKDRWHEGVWCWRCRHTLYDCQCPVADLELWFEEPKL